MENQPSSLLYPLEIQQKLAAAENMTLQQWQDNERQRDKKLSEQAVRLGYSDDAKHFLDRVYTQD